MTTNSPIISINALSKILEEPNLRLVDCRFSLADENWGKAAYEISHIPGAVYAHLNTDLSSPVGPKTGRHPLPDENVFINFVQKSGISHESTVVAYDDVAGSLAAARLWWLLKSYGHQKVAVMDGSYSDWVSSGNVTNGERTSHPRGNFEGKLQPECIVDATTIESVYKNKSKILIDARNHDRFRGENEVIDPVAGHIPGAINRPTHENITSENKFKSPLQLREEFNKILGEYKPEDAILYCGSGVTACYNNLAMEIAGLHGSKIYPGSWSEWITDPRHEIALGE